MPRRITIPPCAVCGLSKVRITSVLKLGASLTLSQMLWPVTVGPFVNKDTARVRWRCFDPARALTPDAFRGDTLACAADRKTTTDGNPNGGEAGPVDLAIEGCPACKQSEGIDVALQWHARLQHIACNGTLEGPVNSKSAYSGHFHVR